MDNDEKMFNYMNIPPSVAVTCVEKLYKDLVEDKGEDDEKNSL